MMNDKQLQKTKAILSDKYSKGAVKGMVHNHVVSLLQAGLIDNNSEEYKKAYMKQWKNVIDIELELDSLVADKVEKKSF